MKTQKMSLANMEGKLSRVEMKSIMAGSGPSSSGDCCPNGKIAHCYGTQSNCNNGAWGDCKVGEKNCQSYCTEGGATGQWC